MTCLESQGSGRGQELAPKLMAFCLVLFKKQGQEQQAAPREGQAAPRAQLLSHHVIHHGSAPALQNISPSLSSCTKAPN